MICLHRFDWKCHHFISFLFFNWWNILVLGVNVTILRTGHDNLTSDPFFNHIILILNFNTMIYRSSHVTRPLDSFYLRNELICCVNIRINWSNHGRFMWFSGHYFIILIIRVISFALINRSSHNFLHFHWYIF